MKTKHVNWMLLGGFIFHIVASYGLSVYAENHEIGTEFSMLAGEIVLAIPALILVLIDQIFLKNKETQEEALFSKMHYKKVKLSSYLMGIVFTFLMMPLTTVVNAISMLFVDNTIVGVSEVMLSLPFLVMLTIVAVVPAFCEETICRGIVYGTYRKEGKKYVAVLVSGLMFGLMHMNFNQALYAFVLGVALALLLEATGSIWTTITFHFIFNAQSCIIMYLAEKIMPGFYQSEMATMVPDESLYMTISVYMVIAAVCTPIAMAVLYWIAKNEGRLDLLMECIPSKKRIETGKKAIITIPLVLAIVIAMAFMIMSEFFV